jgi:hypothetical protein
MAAGSAEMTEFFNGDEGRKRMTYGFHVSFFTGMGLGWRPVLGNVAGGNKKKSNIKINGYPN